MAVKDWSASAALNTSVAGINIGEGMLRAHVNDAIRSVMAEAKGGFKEVVSVKAHGAKGDYNYTTLAGTDDTTAIQAALSAVALTGGELHFPAGVYKVSQPLIAAVTLGKTITITGAGSGNTSIAYVGDYSKPCLQITGNMPDEDAFILKHLTISFSSHTDASSLGIGPALKLRNIRRFEIRDYQSYYSGAGIHLDGCFVGSIHNQRAFGDRIGLQGDQGSYACTASISGTTLTVSAVNLGELAPGKTLDGSGVTTCRIVSQTSGTTGGVGVYVVSTSQTVASTSMAGAWDSGPNAVSTYDCEYLRNRTAVKLTRFSQFNVRGGTVEGVGIEAASLSATASFSGTTMTVTAISNGPFVVGDHISATGISPGVEITAAPAGGGVGTYTLSTNVGTLSSRTVTMLGMGHYLTAAGLNGPRGINCDGTYFEANYGIPVYIGHSSIAPSAHHSYTNCNFDRTTTSEPYSILVDADSTPVGGSPVGLNVTGSIFYRYAGVASSSTPFVALRSTTGFNNLTFHDQGTEYSSTTEAAAIPWIAYIPTVTATSGAITSYTCTAQYKRLSNRTVAFTINVNLVNIGTASGGFTVSAPFAAANRTATETQVFPAVITSGSGAGTVGAAVLSNNATTLTVRNASGAFLGANNTTVTLSGIYEAAA